jgi:hypothetical protein
MRQDEHAIYSIIVTNGRHDTAVDVQRLVRLQKVNIQSIRSRIQEDSQHSTRPPRPDNIQKYLYVSFYYDIRSNTIVIFYTTQIQRDPSRDGIIGMMT